MLNKREFLKCGIGALLPSFLLKESLGNVQTNELHPEIQADYFRYPILSNGIEKIFKFHRVNEGKRYLEYPLGLIYPEDKSNDLVRIPLSCKDFSKTNDECWHVILSCCNSYDNKLAKLFRFYHEKCTDIFIDERSRYENWKYLTKIKLHRVNLSKYYEYYTKYLDGKFDNNKNKLFIACDLSNTNCIIPLNNTEYGVAILDDSKFILGQEYYE